MWLAAACSQAPLCRPPATDTPAWHPLTASCELVSRALCRNTQLDCPAAPRWPASPRRRGSSRKLQRDALHALRRAWDGPDARKVRGAAADNALSLRLAQAECLLAVHRLVG